MILFDKWTIQAQGGVIARQYDNLTRTLTVMGDLPAGWDWSMLVESGGNLNIISLTPVDGGVGVTLTADMIPYAGYYRMQLRGTQGEAVRHTNIIRVYIPESLTGEGQWPDLPSEFGQIEERMQELAGQAQDSADAADTSAKAAAESAAAAQGAEESVAANAKAAQDAANAAQTSEGNAKTSETNAAKSAGDAQKAQQAIEDMTATAETLAPGSEATVTKTVSPEGVVNLEFGIPEGKPGTGDMMSDGSVPMTGNLDMNGNRVTEVGTPTADTDAANKAYVDDALSDKQDTLNGTEDQLVGFNSDGEAVAVAKPTAADVGAVPTTRTINSKPLSSDVTLTAEDVGAGEPSNSTTITLTATGWTGSAAPFSQQVACSIVAADTPDIFIDPQTNSSDINANIEIVNAWALCTLKDPAPGAGTLTFYCTEKPTINIPVKVGVA